MERTCLICGKTFKALGRAKTCSEECSKALKKQRWKEWESSNAEHRAQYIEDNREHHRQLCREWQKNNPEKCKEKRHRHYIKHRDEIIEKHRIAASTQEFKDRKNARRRQQTLENKRKRAIEHQQLLKAHAVEKPLGGNKWSDEYTEEYNRIYTEIGIERESINTCKCLRCGNSFVLSTDRANASHVLKLRLAAGKSPCPYCGDMPVGGGRTVSSSFEKEIQKLYPDLSISNYRPDWMEGMELDLFDPVHKIAVECHGVTYHSTYSRHEDKLVSTHKRKADLCDKAHVQLIQIYDTEWKQSRECVIDRLDAIYHRNMTRYYARKLNVREMNGTADRVLVNRFLDANHIQGRASAKWAVGLFDGEELIAVCTFKYGTAYAAGGYRPSMSYWELNRYATKLHCNVVGGLSRCVKAFSRANQDVHKIVSFADRRWTCPFRTAYTSAGFIETGRVEPNYLYTDLKKSHELRNKQYMRKSAIERRALANPDGPEAKVFSWDKTEQEMSKELGFYRIYDAGKIKYEMKL